MPDILVPVGNTKVTWAQAVRDSVVEAIRRGQLLTLACAAIALLIVWRLPPEELVKLTHDLIQIEERHWEINLILNVALAVGWFIHARSLRRHFGAEFERLSNERNQLQEKLGAKVKSSGRR